MALLGVAFCNAGDASGVVFARAETFVVRSDLRAGVDKDCADAFLARADAAFPFGTDVGPEPLRGSLLAACLGVPFVCVVLAGGRELLGFVGSGVGGAASLFTREDFLTPFSKTVVGPSATNDFHGGDAAREAERRGVVVSSSFRRFEGRSMTPPSWPFTGASWSSCLMGGASSLAGASGWGAMAEGLGASAGSRGGMESRARSAALTSSIQEGRERRPGEP